MVESLDVCPDWQTSVHGLGSTKSLSPELENENGNGSLENESESLEKDESASEISSAGVVKASLGNVCRHGPRECETSLGSEKPDVGRVSPREHETSHGAGEDSLGVEGRQRRARSRGSENFRGSGNVGVENSLGVEV